MAQQDLTGLLTGITSQPISPTAGLDREGRMAARAQGMADTMRRGIIGASGQDPRTLGQKAQVALAQLDPNKKEDRVKILEVVGRVNPERAVALRAAFAEKDKTEAQEARVEGRAERRMEIAEETLNMQKAATKRELDQADALLAQQGVSRALFAEQARENGNEALAEAIETGGITLEKAGSILFGSSNALVKPATPEEAEAFDRILETPEFKEQLKGFDEGWFWWSDKDVISNNTKQAIYFKAKELMARGKMTTEEALTQAIEAVASLDNIKPTGGDGEGGGGGSRKNRRDKSGGNVPESKTDDAFGEV
tara:strand:+ start:801 stop:1730 length:930 start_codon:yes stop_codon:yes gene_type:complete